MVKGTLFCLLLVAAASRGFEGNLEKKAHCSHYCVQDHCVNGSIDNDCVFGCEKKCERWALVQFRANDQCPMTMTNDQCRKLRDLVRNGYLRIFWVIDLILPICYLPYAWSFRSKFEEFKLNSNDYWCNSHQRNYYCTFPFNH